MNHTQRIADAYRAVTVKDAWYAPSLAEVLPQISPELANTPPLPGAHTISALLQHLLLWNERVRLTTDTHPLPRWQAPMRNCPPVSEAELAATGRNVDPS